MLSHSRNRAPTPTDSSASSVVVTSTCTGTSGYLARTAEYAAASEPVRRYHRDHPVQARRESVALTRPDPDPLSPAQAGVLTASFFKAPDTYDPHVVHVRTPAELEALIARADREALPLFVNIGWLRQAARQRPELVALVEDRNRFERVADLPGLTPRYARRVYRYRGLAATP